MNVSTLPSSGRLVWCPQWNSVGEGPYTIVAKMLNANNLKPRYLRSAFRWKVRIGISLLDPRLNESEIEPVATFGRILRQASLAARIPHLYKELADDRHLRFCAKCMSTGFQAAIAQLPGVDRCPIHGEMHRNSCIRCGCKTPPYFLEDSVFVPGFSCRACGAPYGGDVLMDRRLDAWASPKDLYRLDPIHRWLKRMDDSKEIHWINVSEWTVTRGSPKGAEDRKRRTVFAALNSEFLTKHSPKSKLKNKPSILGPYQITSNKMPQELTPDEYEGVLSRLVMPPELQQYRSHLLTPSFGVAVPIDPIVPPELHAHLIWRAQFERVSSLYTQLYSRSEFFRNAILGLLRVESPYYELSLESPAITEGVLGAAWLAALEIAQEWNKTLVSLRKLNSTQANLRWLTAVDQWANRLGCWRNRKHFPVGAIRVNNTATDEHQLYFVVG